MNTEVYIVAGGPSLATFDWDSLVDKDVIAINNAAFKLPTAKYVYFANKDWFELWRDKLKEHQGKIIQGCTKQDVKEEWVERWTFTQDKGLATEPRTLATGVNSGYAAINLAVQLGYKKIFLLGYDMRVVDGQNNYHKDHLWTCEPDFYKTMLAMFETIVEPLKAMSVEVVNLTPGSALTVFNCRS
jgi:hypothetical protein